MPKFKEKRRFGRIIFEEEVSYSYEKGSFKGKLRDISLGGIFISEPEIYPQVGEKITLALFLEGTEPPIKIEFQGEVLRVELGRGFALKLLTISHASLKHLKNFLYYNAPSPEKVEKELLLLLNEYLSPLSFLKELKVVMLKNEIMPFILKRAFLFSPAKPFKLASGKESPYYLDCRKVTLYGPTFKLIGELFWEEIKPLSVLGVAGMSIGADPIVCSILSASMSENCPLEGLLIRKEPKKYGTQRQIEGNYNEGMPIALVEDVVTTGGSLLHAITACEQEGLNILGVYALVDREEGGAEKIRERGYPFKAFFTLSEIISAFHNDGK
ncbi:MAG: orotate phosphoribosyltransferase [Caldimicrobium sp.]